MRDIAQACDTDLYDEQKLLDLYSGKGSEPHDPRLLIKLLVYFQQLGYTKPTRWAELLQSDKNAQWLTFGSRVSRTAMYTFRDRIEPILQKMNDQVVKSAIKRGLIDPHRASLDGSYIAANTSRSKLLNLKKVLQRLEWIEYGLAELQPSNHLGWTVSTLDDQVRPKWLATTLMGLRFQRRMYQKASQKLRELLAANAKRRSDKRKPEDKIVVSVADSDAVFGRDKQKVYRPLYNVQTVCDLDSEMVLGYEVFAQVSDSGTLQTMIDRLIAGGVSLKSLLADSGYPVGEDLRYCRDNAITLYAPWQENSFTAKNKASSGGQEKFTQSDFSWDAEHSHYRCPSGSVLSFSENKSRQRADGSTVPFELYRADPSACRLCVLANRCTESERGRSVRRDADQDLIDALQGRMATDEAKLLYAHRGQTIERLYGDFKEHRGAGRFRGRTLSRARAQYGIMVLGHNLRITLRLLRSQNQEEECENHQQSVA